MSDPKDRLFRHLALLRHIPRAPKSISTSELQKKLKAEEFNIDSRTLQRDLSGRLALDFPLLCDESRRPYLWSFPKDTPRFDFPALDTPTALAFALAQSHLGKLLPPSVLELLAPHFDLAQRQLQGLEHNKLVHWLNCVRAVPNGKALQPAEVQASIWSPVATALLEARQLEMVYLSRSKGENKNLRVHPAGMVSRHCVSYLIGTVEGYSDYRQFALHRIKHAVCLDAPVREQADFDIDQYVHSGGFNNPGPVEFVDLVADVSPQIAWLLSETPLGSQQTLKQLPDSDWQRLNARVPSDQETLWWVFGVGESLRLYEPQGWVDEILVRFNKIQGLYTRPKLHCANACEEA
ncbi:WYL domain-containing protein [Pseudomonas sp. ML2-2023-3]|uniref:helix-turn-helix transcriptional regulator n=1 Tax=Pseudomonas sp. ML2-2023-3 TaxID=3122375 RepID=UPI0030CE8E11